MESDFVFWTAKLGTLALYASALLEWFMAVLTFSDDYPAQQPLHGLKPKRIEE
jgi:hypothetical protein